VLVPPAEKAGIRDQREMLREIQKPMGRHAIIPLNARIQSGERLQKDDGLKKRMLRGVSEGLGKRGRKRQKKGGKESEEASQNNVERRAENPNGRNTVRGKKSR